MGNGIQIKITAWKCIECQKVYLSRIASDLCCEVISEESE